MRFVLIRLTVVIIISWCVCISKHHMVDSKHIKYYIFVNHTSIKLGENFRRKINNMASLALQALTHQRIQLWKRLVHPYPNPASDSCVKQNHTACLCLSCLKFSQCVQKSMCTILIIRASLRSAFPNLNWGIDNPLTLRGCQQKK